MFRVFGVLLVAAAFAAPTASTAPDSASATCRGAISWSAARSAVGRVATVKGPVVDTYYARSSNGSPTFLNLGRAHPSPARFTIVIWSENRASFGAPERRYHGRTVCVRGLVSSYRGIPQITARAPSQIAVAG